MWTDVSWPGAKGASLGARASHAIAVVDLHGGRVAILILYLIVIIITIHVATRSTGVIKLWVSHELLRSSRSRCIIVMWKLDFDFIETDRFRSI